MTVGMPSAAVIVIDLQTGMFDGRNIAPIPNGDRLVDRVNAVIGWARRTGRRIAFIRHDAAPGEVLAPGSAGWPLWPAIDRAAVEPVFGKSVGDALSDIGLRDWLADEAIGEIILVGAQSDYCVAATAKGGLARDLAVTVVADAHGTWPAGDDTAPQIVERINAELGDAGAAVVTTASLIAADLAGIDRP